LEETAQRKKRQRFSEEQKKIKRYKMKTNPLNFSDLEVLDKEDKWEQKRKLATKSEGGRIEVVEGESPINEQEEKTSLGKELPASEEKKEIKPKKRSYGKKVKK
jgi:hypothetical protein